MVAEVVVDLVLAVAQSQLHLCHQERILNLKVNEYIPGTLIEFILNPNNLNILRIRQLIIHPLDLPLPAHTPTPQQIHHPKRHKIQLGLRLLLRILRPEHIEQLQLHRQDESRVGLTALAQILRELRVDDLVCEQFLVSFDAGMHHIEDAAEEGVHETLAAFPEGHDALLAEELQLAGELHFAAGWEGYWHAAAHGFEAVFVVYDLLGRVEESDEHVLDPLGQDSEDLLRF